jgi:hypothetical protein
MEYYRHLERVPMQRLTSPFIYMMIIPFVILDVFTEIYHHICFPSYGLPLVKREEYIRIDRHKLQYLGAFDKLNCAFCGYGNGLLRYAAQIAAETEKYWCSIKHQSGGGFKAPPHHAKFLPYGDEKAFREFTAGPAPAMNVGSPLPEAEHVEEEGMGPSDPKAERGEK